MIENSQRQMQVLILLLVVGAGQVTRLQDNEPDEDTVPAPQQFLYTDENFDQWVFGGIGDAAASRSRLESLLALQIAELERSCQLTPAQKKKLQLAGRGDVKRFFDGVDEKRRAFQLVKNDQNKFGEFYQGLQYFQTALNSGLFATGSLYQKTIKSTLDESQYDRYEKSQRERRAFRYRTKIESVVSTLDSSVGFRVDQRQKLVNLLLNETEPPKKFGQYDYYVVLFLTSKLPEARVKAIFDDAQWRVMSRHLAQAKGMEPFLKSNGLMPEPVLVTNPVERAAGPDQKKNK